jgi:hypothetical protein
MTHENFVSAERNAQSAFFARTLAPELICDEASYRLKEGQRLFNLASSIRDVASRYFGPPGPIVWHMHANHGLSSQACCLNFLMPLATQPDLLARLIAPALGLTEIVMLPVENGPDGEPWHVGFEWVGEHDYLSEWPAGKPPTRGANATSADAIVRFRHEGRIETVLIEWKYTEAYGAPLDPKGNPTREARYSGKVFAPDGPIRSDRDLKLAFFFWEPFYQLLRQQMLAWRMERANENSAEKVSVLHISPTNNTHLHKVTSVSLGLPSDDIFSVFRSLLVEPDRFVSCTTEQVFSPLLGLDHTDPAAREWAAYLRDRYNFLSANRK